MAVKKLLNKDQVSAWVAVHAESPRRHLARAAERSQTDQTRITLKTHTYTYINTHIQCVQKSRNHEETLMHVHVYEFNVSKKSFWIGLEPEDIPKADDYNDLSFNPVEILRLSAIRSYTRPHCNTVEQNRLVLDIKSLTRVCVLRLCPVWCRNLVVIFHWRGEEQQPGRL